METRTTEDPQPVQGPSILDEEVPARGRLAQLGRRIKRIDVRAAIVAHPFAAIGIGAAVGALVGLARPMPKRERGRGVVIGVLTAIGFRLLREAAVKQLGVMAKDYFGRPPEQPTAP